MRPKKIHQYEIHQRLGSGAGGVAYYATDTRLMRPVVLKMLHRRSASDQKKRSKLLEEARIASAIEHPNVCSIYEVGEDQGRPFIAMQHVPGQNLKELIHKGPVSTNLAVSIGIQITDGLAAAHRLGILHRDLKPANVMITEGGLVKILDFGLAKRTAAGALPAPAEDESTAGSSSQAAGTVAYMAPEQFVDFRASEQTDVFSFGVILYEMATGRHPFVFAGADHRQVSRAIQFDQAPEPASIRPDLPAPLQEVLLKAVAKQPGLRFQLASEVRDALKTLMRSLQLEIGLVPGEALAVPASPTTEKKPGLFAILTERFLQGKSARAPRNSIAVLPFQELEETGHTRFYGFALADAIATRLARLPSFAVKPASALLALSDQPPDPFAAGRRLATEYVMTGVYSSGAPPQTAELASAARDAEILTQESPIRPREMTSSHSGFHLSWQLLDVESQAVRSGGIISVPSLDLVAVQSEICDEVHAALLNLEEPPPEVVEVPDDSSIGDFSEDYLEARALLSRFVLRSSHRDDLDTARQGFETVSERAPQFAPAHAGLGITHLHYLRNGFGGLSHLMAAQRHLERALELDPGLVEAKLYRAYTLLWRGEKASARHDVRYLIESAANDSEVHIAAGIISRLDGLLEEALRSFSTALRLNPTSATSVYNHRARIYHYQGRLDLARHEVDKGLAMEPKHLLLRTTLGYLFLRRSKIEDAISTLEAVVADDSNLRLAYPTLAISYVLAGRSQQAASLMTDETLAFAAMDCEMAYRLATYFAVTGDAFEALHWLRKAIYMGYESYPWFARNPAWERLVEHQDYLKILAELKKTCRANRKRWRGTVLDERA